jgi:hypothetical protein
MNNQKVNFIPTYNGVPITDYTPVQSITSLDVIDMPEANKAWSMHVVSEGLGRIKIYAGNSLDLDFVGYDLNLNFDPDIPANISEIEFNYRYMRLELEFEELEFVGSTSISMVK